MSEMKTGICPKCKKELSVPADLAEFSCMYCGERILRADWDAAEKAALAKRNASYIPLADLEEEFKAFTVNLTKCAYEHRKLADDFGKKHDYAERFEEYSVECRGVMREMQRLAESVSPEEQSKAFELVGSVFMDDMQRVWSEGRANNRTREMDRMTIVIFLIPLIRQQELEWCDDFCLAIRDEWVKRYPKEVFHLAAYEDIAGGFRKRWCFITTAVCENAGKRDDCYELTAFRRFRDEELAKTADGRALIEEYYRVAPAIVSCMKYCDNTDLRCRELDEKYLTPCLRHIERGENEACRSLYVKMVKDLENRYFGA